MRPAIAVLVAVATVGAQPQAPPPTRLRQQAAAAGVTAPIAAWCEGQVRAGQRGYALAAGGRYIFLDGGKAVELGRFKGEPDLSCYTRAYALELNRSLQQSDTVSGRVAPRFDTAVICAFIEATAAKCWQYSPSERIFVEVGAWTT